MTQPDITERIALLQRTVELNTPLNARWSTHKSVATIERCDICDKRIASDVTTLKQFGDPHVIARLHVQCFEWFSFLQRQD